MSALPSALLLTLAQSSDQMVHDRLDAAMFWVGAMFAFTPILVAIGVGCVIWWQRRKRQAEPGTQ